MNICYETLLIDYKLLVKTEYYSLKNAFFLAKCLIEKIKRSENFFNIDQKDF